MKRVRPGALSNSMIPWCWLTKLCASDSPRPVPPSRPLTSGIEDPVGDLVGHAGAVVLDDHDHARGGSAARAIVTWRAMRVTKRISPSPVGGLRGVARDVEHRLDQLLLVAHDVGQARVVVALDRRSSGNSASEQRAHALDHLVDVDRRDVRQAVGREQAIHERLQAVGLLHDHLRELAQLRVGELALEQLRRAADAAQRVLDLVGEVADQLPVGLLLLEDLRLARDAPLLLELAHLHEQARLAGLDRA